MLLLCLTTTLISNDAIRTSNSRIRLQNSLNNSKIKTFVESSSKLDGPKKMRMSNLKPSNWEASVSLTKDIKIIMHPLLIPQLYKIGRRRKKKMFVISTNY